MSGHRGKLGKTIAGISLGTSQRMAARGAEATYYKMAERTQQFQFDVGGTLGVLPVENSIAILFDIMFLYEYGTRRDSQLLEPQTHFGWTSVAAPPGSVPYAHVTGWNQDGDLNYIGCDVTAGVHNPMIGIAGTDPTTSLTFTATLHASFGGYGVPLDPADGDS
jgi:hypothetical protein